MLRLLALTPLLAGLALPGTVLASDWTDGFNGSVGNWSLRTGTAMTYSTAPNHNTYTGAGCMKHALGSSEMYRSTGSRPYHAGKVTGYFYDTQMYRAGVCGNTYRQLLGFAASTYGTYQLSVGLYSAGGAGNYYRRDSGSSYTSMGARGNPGACSVGGWVTYVVEFQANGNCYRSADDGYISPLTSTVARSQAVIDAGIGMVTVGLGASSANQGYWDDIAWDGYTPGTPTGLAAIANSTSQITWTANAASDNNQYGFALMNGGTEEEVSSTTTRATSASFVRTDLSANTAYTRGIRAWNGDNNSAAATAITRYTLQNTPTAPTFGTITLNSIVLNVAGPVNLTGNSGVYFDSTTTGGDGGINGWVQATTDTATGLAANTEYTFQAKARNGESVETAYSSTASKYTLIQTPAGVTFGTITLNSIDAAPSGTLNNLTAGTSGVRVSNTTAGNNSGWEQDTSGYTSSELSANTAYSFVARAKNADGIETGDSATFSKYTLIETPATPTFGTVTADSIGLNTSGLSNPTAGSSGAYFDSTTAGGDGGINGWVSGTTDTATGLSANTEYTFQVMARNGDAVETGYSGTASKYTLIQTPTGVSFGTITETSIDATPAGTLNNLAAGSSGVRVSNTTASNDSGWEQDTSGYTSSGLVANTEYTFVARAKNADGIETGDSTSVSAWTLSVPPGAASVTPDKPNPCADDPVTWAAPAGFGAGKVAKYKYVWDQNPTHTWTESEGDWSSGTIQTSPAGTGTWYLHIKGYNGADVGNGTYSYSVTGATPSVGGTTSTTP